MTVPQTILQRQTIADGAGDWTRTVPFNQFDPADGDLLDAAITTAGAIDASASIENLAPVAASINLGVASTIVATAPDIGVVGSVTPSVYATVNLGAFQGEFDGSLDFSGASGTVLPDISGSQSQTMVIPTGSIGVLPFVGTGTFDVGVTSYATSTVNGNGNLAVLLHSTVGAVVSLQYDATSPGGGGGDDGDVSTSGINIFVGFAPFGNFTTTVPQVVTLPSQTSGWTSTASFARFDPSLGTLQEIILNVGNTVAGTFSAENLESVPAPVSMTETASMSVALPGVSAGITATASGTDYLGLGAYDGTAGFSGASGHSDTIDGTAEDQAIPAGQETGAQTLTDSTDLAAFTGTGTIVLPVTTSGTSVVTGPSNMLSEITQHTGGTVAVSYVYSPVAVTDVAGPMAGNAHPSAVGTVGWLALGPPALAFIGAIRGADPIEARSNEKFLVGSGATATIDNFDPAAGDRLNLTGLLAGAPLANDLKNIGAFINVASQAPDPNGGTDTTLSLSGPGGAASLVLVGAKAITVADLLNDNALVLPPH